MLCRKRFPARPCRPPARRGTPLPDTREADQKRSAAAERASEALLSEVELALDGEPQANVRRSEDGDRVVSVSIPVRHVQQVLGVLTLEAGDVDEILGAQRRALTPFALVALAVNLLASLLLHLFVAPASAASVGGGGRGQTGSGARHLPARSGGPQGRDRRSGAVAGIHDRDPVGPNGRHRALRRPTSVTRSRTP